MQESLKIALTGGSGHLGSEIVRQLLQRGHTVKALIHHDRKALDGLDIELVKGSLQDIESLKELVKGCDILIHSAALISISGAQGGAVNKTNVEGVKHLYDAATAEGIKKIIHISSIHAFQQTPTLEMLNEESPWVDDSAFAYDVSKRRGQELALSYIDKGMEVVVLNPTSIIGPPDHKPSLQGKAIIDIYKGKVPAVFDGGFDFVDNRDVATAVINAINKGRSGENYLLAGKWISMYDMIRLVNLATGKHRKAVRLPFWFGFAIEPFFRFWGWITRTEPLFTKESLEILRIGNRNISSEKAKRELNFNPRPLEEAFSDSFSWFKTNGYL